MRLLAYILAVVAVALAGCASVAPRHATTDPVILISIDGFRADYLDRGRTPALAALGADGVRADALKPSFPTLTFPNHYTLVTGLYPDHHGIVNNRMSDPARATPFVYKDAKSIADPAWWGGEPIWVAVEKRGEHAATMFWPGSDVAIDGVRPSRWMHFDARDPPARRVDQLLRWSDLRGDAKPVLYTLYFEQVDHAGHVYGPDSPEVDAALAEIDGALARLVAGLKSRGTFDRTSIVVVSDHGMTPAGRDMLIFLDDLIDVHGADVVNVGVLTGLDPDAAHAATIERTLLAPHDHMTCWRKNDVPARFHYGTNPRIPALLCLADDGWVVTTRDDAAKRASFSLGEHGYDNDDPAMRALFVAHGPSFARGRRVAEFPNVDVYPLLARLLDIAPQPNDGDPAVVDELLRR
jgi:predicted AlkP superfamily pyrophosphatase or phosphodiesterase